MKYISILPAIICIAITGGCSNNSPEDMPAKEWLGLEGNVKNIFTEREVTVPESKSFFGQTENMITFDLEGNITYINNYITEMSGNGNSLQHYNHDNGVSPEYISFTKEKNGINSIIIRSLINSTEEDSTVRFLTQMDFDEKKRLTDIYDNGLLADILQIEGRMESLEIKFEYSGKDRLPDKANFKFDNRQSINLEYKYIKADKFGNWTQRYAKDIENGHILFYESRQIDYYE